MAPDLSHVGPMAQRMVDAIVSTMADHGITRPDGGLVIDGAEKWDAEVANLRAALHEMIELDAIDKF